ncbi:MAG TPA: hypothetical protein VFZ24_15540 [Longimicrobiales bacterium]
MALRAAAVLAAGAIVAFGLMHPGFRRETGALNALFCVPLAASAAILLLGAAARTVWARAAGWLALAIAGQAAALQLVNAGTALGYQHYPPPAALLARADMPALIVLAVQAAIVMIAGGGRLRGWLRALWNGLGAGRMLLVAAAFVLSSAALSANVVTYGAELIFASAVQAVNLATVALAAAALPTDALARLGRGFDRVLGSAAGVPRPGGVDRFALVAASGTFVVCALLAWFVYQAHPHVPDEVVYLYHARYFANGMLSMPLPPVPEAFNLDLMTYEATRWYSPVPPGWPAALAIGAFFGVPWLVSPVLNGLNVLLAYALLRDVLDLRTARIATLLLCVSPWFVFMGMNFMTHTFTLTCGLGAAVAVARLRRGGSIAWAVPGGIGIGVMGMIRPLEGLTAAVLLGFWGLGRWPWSGRQLGRVAALAAVAIAAGATTLPYNAHLAGDAFTFPLMAYTDAVYGPGSNALGFGPERGLGWSGLDPFPGHGLPDVVVNAALNTYSVNVELLGWSIGAVLPLALLLVLAGRTSRADRWLLAAIAAVVGVHSLYWFSGGPDFGARYWYLILVPCIALVARAPAVLAQRFDTDLRPAHRSTLHDRLLAGMLALSLSALICFFPWRALDKYYHYRNMRPDVRQLAAAHDFGRSIVLVRGARRVEYASAAIYNPLDLQADAPVYIWDRDPRITRDALLAYEDRPVWILDGPTATGGGFRVVAGPLRARDLIEELRQGP